MPTILVCRTCGTRAAAELADNQQELAAVGMLEQACEPCGKPTFWIMAATMRRGERRKAERRQIERRLRRTAVPMDHRTTTDRRRRQIRQGRERRAESV
jgi:hypothetical protein